MRRSLVPLALALIAMPAAARAQALRVTAVDAGTGAPVANALLTATDTAGRPVANVVAAVVTAERGPRLLPVPGAGTYRVLVRRIGQRPYTSPPVTVGAKDTVSLALRVPTQPVTLSAVRIRANAACTPGGPEGNAETAALWDQIRTAITLVALQAEDSGAARPLIRRYAARLTGDGATVRASTVLPAMLGQPRPFGTLDPDSLSRHGYIWHGRSQSVYAIPDEAVLLSPAFEADHCFDAVAGSGGDQGLVGLSFAPVRTRRGSEIAGVLWADAATAALRYLEFWYVDGTIPDQLRGPGRAGGEVHFAPLPDGRWSVVAWRLRTPLAEGNGGSDEALVRRMMALSGFGIRTALGGAAQWGLTEVGAVAESPATAHATGALAQLVARVHDGRATVRARDAAGRTLGGAALRLVQQPDTMAAGFDLDPATYRLTRARSTPADVSVTADSGGVATVALPPGRYLVRAQHRVLDSVGVQPPPAELFVAADAASEVVVAPPRLADVYLRCASRESGSPAGGRALYGTVLDDRDVPLRGARVTVRWGDGAGVRKGSRRIDVGDDGAFAICGLPDAVSVSAEAGHGRLRSDEETLGLEGWRATHALLSLRPEGEARRGPPVVAITGTVVDSVSVAPLVGAVVQIVDAANIAGHAYIAVTDSVGGFHVDGVPPGRYLVGFSHPMLDTYNIELAPGVSTLPAGWRAATFTLAVPGAGRLLATTCPSVPAEAARFGVPPDSIGLVIGRVRDRTNWPVGQGARVRVIWTPLVRTAGRHGSPDGLEAVVGPGGLFHICGVPRGRRLTLTADAPGGERSAFVEVVVPPTGVAVRDLLVRPAVEVPERGPALAP